MFFRETFKTTLLFLKTSKTHRKLFIKFKLLRHKHGKTFKFNPELIYCCRLPAVEKDCSHSFALLPGNHFPLAYYNN